MSNEALWLLAAALGAIVGIPLAGWLRQVSYRKPDETDLPLPGSRWWVPPNLGLAIGLICWRIWFAAPSLGQSAPADPGADLATGQPVPTSARIVLTVMLVALAVAGVCLAAMDFDVKRLPDRIIWPTWATILLCVALAGLLTSQWSATGRALLAGAVCTIGYLLLALVTLSRGSLALGLGDVKLAGMIGTALGWFGWGEVLLGMYTGFLVGGVFALVLLATGQVRLKGHLPYGPPMLFGALLGWWASPTVLAWF